MTNGAGEEDLVARVPSFIRRRLGVRSRSRYPYDAVVPVGVGSNAYMVTDADAIRHVLGSNAANYTKPPQLTGPQGRARAGSGLLTSVGAAHRRQRLLLQPVFRQAAVASFAGVVESRTRQALARWRRGQELDIAREMSDLSLSILMGALFGVDFCDEGGRLASAIRTRRRYTEHVYYSRLPFRDRLPTRIVRQHADALARIDEQIYSAMAARRKPVAEARDLVTMLMNVRYPDGTQMTDRQVRDEVLTLTSTGHETIGDALGWTWYLLARHPEVEQDLLAESTEGSEAPPAAADADPARFEYAHMVLSESLRLYPPTWIYARVPVEDDELPDGQKVGSGTRLLLSPYLMHRHPRYFPDPERFDPERFREPHANQRPGFVYFPFGGGPHRCIGEGFARFEGVLVLAQIARRFRFELMPGQRVVPKAAITLYPRNGIRVRVLER